MPKMGDAMEEGTLLEWKKQDGETVALGDVIAEIETDKSNVEIEAEDAGVLHVKAEAGAVLPVGTVIAVIGDDTPLRSNGGGSSKPAAAARLLLRSLRRSSKPSAAASPPPSTTRRCRPPPPRRSLPPSTAALPPSASKHRRWPGQSPNSAALTLPASPVPARRDALLKPTLWHSSPLLRRSRLRLLFPCRPPLSAATCRPRCRRPAAPMKRADYTPSPLTTPTELSAMRKVIARRMTESKTTIPHFYITAEVDMAEAMALREMLNAYGRDADKKSR